MKETAVMETLQILQNFRTEMKGLTSLDSDGTDKVEMDVREIAQEESKEFSDLTQRQGEGNSQTSDDHYKKMHLSISYINTYTYVCHTHTYITKMKILRNNYSK